MCPRTIYKLKHVQSKLSKSNLVKQSKKCLVNGEQTAHAHRGFLRLGLERQNAVGIMGANSPEWFISSVAAIFAGGLRHGRTTHL